MAKIQFFDNIQTNSRINNFVEDYFYLGRTFNKFQQNEYILLDGTQDTVTLKKKQFSKRTKRVSEIGRDYLKILSYLTVIIPFTLLLRKVYFRLSHSFHIKTKLQLNKITKIQKRLEPLNVVLKDSKNKKVEVCIPSEIMSNILDYAVGDLELESKINELSKLGEINQYFYFASRKKIKDLLDKNPDFLFPKMFRNVNERLNFHHNFGITKLDFQPDEFWRKSQMTNYYGIPEYRLDNLMESISKKHSSFLQTVETFNFTISKSPGYFSEDGAKAIVPHLKKVKVFRCNCEDLSQNGSGFDLFATHFKKLKILELSNQKISGKTFIKFLENNPKLRELSISSMQFQESTYIESIRHMKSLETLRLRNCNQTLPILKRMVQGIPNLKKLEVENMDEFDEKKRSKLEAKYKGLQIITK